MTQEHALRAYKNFKEQLENPKYANTKKVWRDNAQHAMDSILIRHPEFKDISEEKEEEEKPTKSKKGK